MSVPGRNRALAGRNFAPLQAGRLMESLGIGARVDQQARTSDGRQGSHHANVRGTPRFGSTNAVQYSSAGAETTTLGKRLSTSVGPRASIDIFRGTHLYSLVPPATVGVQSASCLGGAIAIWPGPSIEAAVGGWADSAVFCPKNGIHRAPAVRPRPRQHAYREGATILNGSRPLTAFQREDRYWVASSQPLSAPKYAECLSSAPACDRPDALFIEDQPLTKVVSKDPNFYTLNSLEID
jgi:hypothetical protein